MQIYLCKCFTGIHRPLKVEWILDFITFTFQHKIPFKQFDTIVRIPNILDFWILIRKNMRIHESAKYQLKTAKKTLLLSKLKSELFKKERSSKNVLIFEWFIKLLHKN